MRMSPKMAELGGFARVTPSMSPSPAPAESELTTRQAALVDSAFEEGQYESGIAMLQELCSPTVHPSK